METQMETTITWYVRAAKNGTFELCFEDEAVIVLDSKKIANKVCRVMNRCDLKDFMEMSTTGTISHLAKYDFMAKETVVFLNIVANCIKDACLHYAIREALK